MTEQTFFWYDLETTGIKPREDRVMQFAGQRTSLDLKPIGDPVNILIRLSDDILPSPDAILITGITPQQTIAEGITEADFLKLFNKEIALPGTIFVGFNTVRFDDEFIRFMQYRNFYDAYTWQWKDDRSRWDLLDVVRMTRALRPDGIAWPEIDGVATNRLELLTKKNGIHHANAHDALADVQACISIAKLIHEKQPKLFTWLLALRSKTAVEKFIRSNPKFVYTSGKFPGEYSKTSVVKKIAEHPKIAGVIVYDLRHDPKPFLELSPQQLVERWQWTSNKDAPPRLPIKTMHFNRCPAAAPLGVLDSASWKRIGLSESRVEKHESLLQKNPDFIRRVLEALKILDILQSEKQSQHKVAADQALYDGFLDSHDTNLLRVVRASQADDLTDGLMESFHDNRLKSLLPLYKARNFSSKLSDEERIAWESYRHHALLDGGKNSRLAQFMHRLNELASEEPDDDATFLLQELQLYAESIMPLMGDE